MLVLVMVKQLTCTQRADAYVGRDRQVAKKIPDLPLFIFPAIGNKDSGPGV
jgi:hypothetical protein